MANPKPPPPPDDLRGALSPGSTTAGSTLKLDFTSPANVDDLVVTLAEVDLGNEDEPAGKDELVGRFFGKLVDHKFVFVPRKPVGKTPPPNPEPNSAVPATAPRIKVEIGGSTHDFGLPGRAQEHGVFELRITMSAPGHKTWRSDAIVHVRDFQYYKAKGIPRPVITFVTGDDKFMNAAAAFWRRDHADAVFVRPGIGLEGIVTFLRTFKSKFGAWGQVNIVNHGNIIPMFIRLFDSEPGEAKPFLDAHKINEAFDPKATRSVATLKPAGLDADSQVVFRACNAGKNAFLLAALNQKVFAGNCPVFVPKFFQGYVSDGSEEFFAEALFFFHKSATSPTATEIESKMQSLFTARYPGASWATERASFQGSGQFAERNDLQHFNRFVTVREDAQFSSLATGAKKTDADLRPLLDANWTSNNLKDDDRLWLTEPADWEVTIDSRPKAGVDDKAYWFESSVPGKAAPNPKILLRDTTGIVSIGSSTSSDISLPVKDVAPDHATVKINSFGVGVAPFDLLIEAAGSNSLVVDVPGNKPFTVASGGSATATGQATLHIGSASVTVRFPKMIALEFGLRRRFIQRLRRLRLFDKNNPTQPFADRPLIVPDLTKSDHYGKGG